MYQIEYIYIYIYFELKTLSATRQNYAWLELVEDFGTSQNLKCLKNWVHLEEIDLKKKKSRREIREMIKVLIG